MRTSGSTGNNTNVHYEQPKPPCKCGCKGEKFWDASVPASPQIIRELDEEVKVILQKAKQVRINGHPGYCCGHP